MPTEPSLPDDLVAEILSYLPFETTTRFKSVSTSWRRLICHDPYFISLQRRRRADRAIGFFHCSVLTPMNICFEPLPNAFADEARSLVSSISLQLGGGFRYFILSSSNGRFLMGSYYHLFVWDPITKARIIIFPPPKHGMLFGLAASPTTNSFQIVAVSKFGSSPFIFIYSSKTRSWTEHGTESVLVYTMHLNPVGPTFMGGAMHWLAQGSILAFDLESRRSRVIELPRNSMAFKLVTGSFLNVWFGGFEGNLYLVFVSVDVMELWRLEECWKKVMEAKEGGGWGAPLFFDGRRIAFSTGECKKYCGRIKFYDTCCREWQGSMNCNYLDFVNRCFVPYFF